MKSLVLALVIVCVSLNFASAETGAKGNQPKDDGIKVIRDWK